MVFGLLLTPTKVTPEPAYRTLSLKLERMTTQYLYDDIKRDEGEKLFPYKDSVGIWTIGVGHNLKSDPTMNAQLTHLLQTGITPEMSRALFDHDLQAVKLSLDLHIPWWRNMDDVRQDALANMCFNLGCAELMTWHHTLDALKAGDYELASHNLLSSEPWHSQIPHRADRIGSQIKTGVRAYQ
jgi:lysozyme